MTLQHSFAGYAAGALLAFAACQASGADRRTALGRAESQCERSLDVPQDVVHITLAYEQQSDDPATLAEALNQRTEQVLLAARRQSGVTASTGALSIYPSTDRDGHISGWRGHSEVRLDSHDFAAASKLAGSLSPQMQVSNVTFSLSPQARDAAQTKLGNEAIAAFRQKAVAASAAFGFGGYTIREVSVSEGGKRAAAADDDGAHVRGADGEDCRRPARGGRLHGDRERQRIGSDDALAKWPGAGWHSHRASSRSGPGRARAKPLLPALLSALCGISAARRGRRIEQESCPYPRSRFRQHLTDEIRTYPAVVGLRRRGADDTSNRMSVFTAPDFNAPRRRNTSMPRIRAPSFSEAMRMGHRAANARRAGTNGSAARRPRRSSAATAIAPSTGRTSAGEEVIRLARELDDEAREAIADQEHRRDRGDRPRLPREETTSRGTARRLRARSH